MSSISIKSKNSIYYFIIVACFLSRLPQLISPNLVLDGDECVVAIMAKHILAGKGFPLYFYGQSYGFSLIESLYVLPFYLLLGINTLAVKLGMLSLWTTGVVFLYKTLKAINTNRYWLPLLLVLVFICSPAWAVWSMKARGGYLTSFMLSNMVLWLLASKNGTAVYILIGLLILLIYESQPFWLVGVLPILGYKLFSPKGWLKAGSLLIVSVPVGAALHVYKATLQQWNAATIVPDSNNIAVLLMRIPNMVYVSLHGNYFFSQSEDTYVVAAICSVAMFALIIALALTGLYFILFKRNASAQFICATVFIPGVFLYTFFSPHESYRYLLPISGFALIALQILANKLNNMTPALYAGSVYILTGALSLVTFYNFHFSEMGTQAMFTALVKALKQNKVRYVYSVDTMLPWQLMFYSNETIIGRTPYLPGRYPVYTEDVDNALARGERVAAIGFLHEHGNLSVPTDVVVDNCFISLGVERKDLEATFYFNSN